MFSIGHILLLLVIVLILFGAGKLPRVMGDLAKGMKAFKDGLNEGNEKPEPVMITAKSTRKRTTSTRKSKS